MAELSDWTLCRITDVLEAAERVFTSLGGDGFSESVYQRALAAELPGCQTEVTRCIYHRTKDGRSVAVGTVRFDIVYYNIVIEMKVYPTKTAGTTTPPALQAQLRAYQRVLFKNEVLLSLEYYQNRLVHRTCSP